MGKHVELYEFEPMLGPCEEYPVGTPEWAERISNRLQLNTAAASRATVGALAQTITVIWRAEPPPWDIWPIEKPYHVPDDYCRAVTGHDWNTLIDIVEKLGGTLGEEAMRATNARAQVAHRKQGTRTDLHVDNINKLKRGGTGVDYLLRRLARDFPEILERYERGEFRSVRAAAIEAGIIKQPALFDQFCRLITKMSVSDRRRGLRFLEQQVETEERAAVSKNQLAMFQ